MNEVDQTPDADDDRQQLIKAYGDLGIGPATAYALAGAYSKRSTIGHESAAALLGMAGKTLRKVGDDGKIPYHLKGTRTRTYTEGDIIRFISATSSKERTVCPSINQGTRATGNTTSSGEVRGFTAQREKHRSGAQKKSSTGSSST